MYINIWIFNNFLIINKQPLPYISLDNQHSTVYSRMLRREDKLLPSNALNYKSDGTVMLLSNALHYKSDGTVILSNALYHKSDGTVMYYYFWLKYCLYYVHNLFYCFTAQVLKVCRTPGPTACSRTKMLQLPKVCLKS